MNLRYLDIGLKEVEEARTKYGIYASCLFNQHAECRHPECKCVCHEEFENA